LENNTTLQSQCFKFEKDVQHLRLANAGLEKASEARFVYLNKIKIIWLIFFFFFSQGLANVNNKLTVANEEVIMHLREKGEVSSVD
jgi:hypothetical protein